MNHMKRIFNKFYIKMIILLLIFIIVVGLYFLFAGEKKEEPARIMGQATLPVVYMDYQEERINSLHGYAQEMETVYMRDSITPIPDDYSLGFEIDHYGMDVKEIHYEVRTLDAENLVEKGKVSDWTSKDDSIKAKIELDDVVKSGTEYVLILKLKTGDFGELNYYTRIISQTESALTQQMDFVDYFSECTFDKSRSEELIPYLEPDSTKNDNSNFGLVDIYSNYKQVSWGEMSPQKVTVPVITIKELFGNIGCFQLEYMVSIENGKNTEYYNVTEYYKVSIANDKEYLLDYERKMEQVFNPSSTTVTSRSINLGIDSDLQVDFKTSPEGDYVSFAKEGELWCMDTSTNQITKVFSFKEDDTTDIREHFNQYDIKVVSVDDQGNVEFLLYGYMNRGKHEGRVGLGLYQYMNDTGANEEIVFIPSSRPYQVLAKTLGKLLYVRENALIYIMIDDYIYSIDITGNEYVEVASGIRDGNYVVSYNSDKIAWHVGGSVNKAEEIRVLDLKTGESHTVRAEDGKYVKALGFVGEAFAYGVADKEDLLIDSAGLETLYMHEVRVTDSSNQVQRKEYAENVYYTGATNEYNRINLKRVQKNGDGFADYPELYIYDMMQEQDSVEILSESTVDTYKKQLVLNFINRVVVTDSLKTVISDEIVFNLSDGIPIKNMISSRNSYSVYARGVVVEIYDELVKAIRLANEQNGLVVDDKQQYVWVRGIRKSSATLSNIEVNPATGEYAHLSACIDAVLKFNGITGVKVAESLQSSSTALSIINEHLDDRGLDLTGATLDEVLYFISSGQPVISLLGNSDADLIVGYDAYNVVLFNLDTGETYKMGMDQAKSMFEQNGNRFISIGSK